MVGGGACGAKERRAYRADGGGSSRTNEVRACRADVGRAWRLNGGRTCRVNEDRASPMNEGRCRGRISSGPFAVRRLVLLMLLPIVLGGAVLAYAWSAQPAWWLRLSHPLEYEHIVLGHAENYDLDPALIAAVIYRESRFDPDAVSESGAVGLMQLLPDTAEGIAELTGGAGFVVSDLHDPEINVRYGSFYLRRLLTKYDGDLELALAAYHAGQGNVDQWLEQGRRIEFAETREYVDDVVELTESYRKAYDTLAGEAG
jgi:soluble lytic murein transglycosylase